MMASEVYQQREIQQLISHEDSFDLEHCCLCSSFFEKPQRSYAQPYVNRLICKTLEVRPPTAADGTSTYFNQYIPICQDCTGRVKTYDKKRVELDVLKQEIVSLVLDTLLHIRPNDKSPVHSLKHFILERWSKESLPFSTSTPCSKPATTAASDSKKRLYSEPPTIPTPSRPKRQIGEPIHANRVAEFIKQRQNPNKSIISAPKTITTESMKSDTDMESDQPNPSHSNHSNPTEQTSPTCPVWEVGNEVNIITDTSTPQHEHLATATTEYIAQHIVSEIDHEQGYSDNDVEDHGVDQSHDHEDDVSEVWTASEQKRNEPRSQNCSPKRRNLGEDADANATVKRKRKRTEVPKAPQHRRQPFFCEACGRVFSNLTSLRRHASSSDCKAETEDTVKECPICSTDFSNLDWLDLKFHIDEKHPNVSLEKCRFCKREFLPNTITWHRCSGLEMVPEPTKEFPCDYCDKLYHTSGSLSKHMYRKHISSSSVEKAFKCDICNRTFISNSLMEVHKATHKPTDNLIACKVCGVGYKSTKLQEHLKCHGERKYVCKICDKGFFSRNPLRIHAASHSDQKNYSCDICDKKFKTHSTMHRHWKRHLNPLPGIKELCPLCNSGTHYKKTKTLKKHMLEAHPGSAEQIEICSRPDDPEEDLIFSQSKTPASTTPKAKKGQRKARQSVANKKHTENSSSEEDEGSHNSGNSSEEDGEQEVNRDDSDIKEEVSLVENATKSTNQSDEIPQASSRSLTMSTRQGGRHSSKWCN